MNEYETFEDAGDNIQAFIEDVYNSKRMPSTLGYLSPIEFEQKLKEKQQEDLYIITKLSVHEKVCSPSEWVISY